MWRAAGAGVYHLRRRRKEVMRWSAKQRWLPFASPRRSRAASSSSDGAYDEALPGARETLTLPGAFFLLQHHQPVPFADRLRLLAADLRHLAVLGRLDRHLHLHALEDHQHVAGLHLVADLLLDLPDGAGDVRRDVGHGQSLSRKWVWSAPRANESLASTRWCSGMFVFTPSTTKRPRASRIRAVACARVSPCATIFASSES